LTIEVMSSPLPSPLSETPIVLLQSAWWPDADGDRGP
jgi:hypothetical protein